jgi:hypothetical protein
MARRHIDILPSLSRAWAPVTTVALVAGVSRSAANRALNAALEAGQVERQLDQTPRRFTWRLAAQGSKLPAAKAPVRMGEADEEALRDRLHLTNLQVFPAPPDEPDVLLLAGWGGEPMAVIRHDRSVATYLPFKDSKILSMGVDRVQGKATWRDVITNHVWVIVKAHVADLARKSYVEPGKR